MTLSQGHDTIAWDIINIQYDSKELLVGYGFCFYVNLDLEDMTLDQGHGKTLGNGQQLYGILSISNLTGMSYGPDTGFFLACVNCDIDLGDITLGHGHDKPFGI